jgi:hypothetical protein
VSEENLEGVADVLEELAGMKATDPEGYEAVLQDLRSEAEGEGDRARQHGQEILDILHARNSQGADPLLEILNRAHRAKAGEG